MTVLLGAYNLDVKFESGDQQRAVHEIHVHPDWSVFSLKFDADLAVFVLKEIVEFTRYIRPICMPDDNPPVDVKGSVVGNFHGIILFPRKALQSIHQKLISIIFVWLGWGLTENSTLMRPSSYLRLTNAKILNDSYCYTTKPKFAFVSSTRSFCGYGEGGGSPSRGDSGGGFFVLSGKSWIQYGIVSAGEIDPQGNSVRNGITIYTNVRPFKSWINEVVRNSGYSSVSYKGNEKIDLLCSYEVVGEQL